jgi:hypothetical protein
MTSNFDFSKAFINNQKMNVPDEGEVFFTAHYLDELVIVSGKLLACDPLCFIPPNPLRERLAPGRYPVIASVIHIPRQDNHNLEFIAFAQVKVQEKLAVRWEPANSIGDDKHGYPVDSGIASFVDDVVAEIVFDCDDEDYTDTYANRLIELIEEKDKNEDLAWGWANLCIDPSTQANVIAFMSGFGDGIYGSYFGYDEENNLVSIVTDFSVVDFSGAIWL